MTARRWSISLIAIVATLALAWPAAAQALPAPTTLAMQPAQTIQGGLVVLSAVLTGANGSGVANQSVRFLMATNLLGQTEAAVGDAITDTSGAASVAFVPTRAESRTFSARFAGTPEFAPAEAQAITIEMTVPPPPPPTAAKQAAAASQVAQTTRELNIVGRWVPWTALALGVGTWIALMFVVVRTVVLVPAAARRRSPTE